MSGTAVLVYLFSDFFVKNGENEKGCRHECGDTAGSGADFIRQKESAQDTGEAVGERGQKGDTESFGEPERRGDGKRNHRGNDEDTDRAYRYGDSGGYEESKKVIDNPHGDFRDFCSIFIISDIHELVIKDKKRNCRRDGEKTCDCHIGRTYGEDTSEEVGIRIGMESSRRNER